MSETHLSEVGIVQRDTWGSLSSSNNAEGSSTVAASTTMKRFLDAKKSPTRVLGAIERHLMSRSPENRSTTVLHPSEIIKPDFCLRSSWFLMTGVASKAERPNLKMQSIFDQGHQTHEKWQRWFYEMGVMHGKFLCLVCDQTTFGTSPKNCESCGSARLMYDEVRLIDNSLRIAGHTDGHLRGIGEDCLLEIKTIGPGTIRWMGPQLMSQANGDFMKAWNLIKAPFGAHVLQIQVYLELAYRMGITDLDGNPIDEAVFVYELKADNSFKEFTRKRDFELVRHVFDKAERVIAHLDRGVEPDCTNNPAGKCKQCENY